MWKSTFISLVLCVCLSLAAKTKLTVYYESLCPDSRDFIVNQLTPASKTVVDKIDVNFVPFGFASAVNSSGQWEFTCQHGPGECYGNRVHSCALALYPKEYSTTFVECAMASGDSSSDENLQKCAEEAKIAWASLQQCLASGQADELLVANGIRTDSVDPKITWIPTIVFNDIYSGPLQRLSSSYFEDLAEFLTEEAECGGCHITAE